VDRWRLSDFQRIVIYFSVVATVFLVGMAWGWRNPWLLFAAASVLAVSIVSVFVVSARRGAGAHEIATARVISVADPPPNTGIAARCDMQLEVRLPGRPLVRTRHRDPAVPLTRWPQPGQTYPVDVVGGNPRRRLRIRWDLVDQGMVRAPEPGGAAATADTTPGVIWEEENDPVVYSPTPPRPRRPPAPSAAPAPTPPPAAEPPAPVAGTGVYLHETFTDLDDETVRTPPAPPHDPPTPARLAPNGHDPDGYDPADFETPQLSVDPAPAVTGGPGFESLTLSEFDPAEVDIRDFTGEPPAVTVMPADDDQSTPAAPAAAPATATSDPEAPTIPQPRDPTGANRGGTGISATRPVTDLPRALRFYRDALGFTVAVSLGTTAVVERQGNRVLLAQAGDPAQAATGEIHLDVTDIEASCAAAQEHAGKIVEAPVVDPRAGTRRARLHDPDGHTLELIEARQPEE
jgi:predicted enzyme related to lactoylglutathione lyase